MRTLCQKSGSVGLEAHRAQVVARGEANVGVEGSRETAKQGDGRLGAALLDALNLINGHARTHSEFGYGHRQSGAPVVQTRECFNRGGREPGQ